MIRTKDLRIGNIVTDKSGFLFVVVSIFKNEVYLDFDDNEGDFFEEDFSDINPYPLTEELLIKIGAVKNTHNDLVSYQIAGMQIKLINKEYIESVNGIKLIGLHSLQNIFYFCKGEELIISISNI